MSAGRGERAGAGAYGYLAFLEVREEGVPFLVGRGPVFLAGPGGAAAGDERPVRLDRLGGVDGLVSDRGVDVPVTADDLGDVRRQAAHDRVGHEDPPEVVRGEHERIAGGVGEAGRGERADEQLADRAGGERPVLAATSLTDAAGDARSEEHTSELQSHLNLV